MQIRQAGADDQKFHHALLSCGVRRIQWASPSAAGPLELTLPILVIVGIILGSVDNVDMVVTVDIDGANFYWSRIFVAGNRVFGVNLECFCRFSLILDVRELHL